MKKHFDITVKGKVQGVFFRANTKEKAEELGLTGFVKNEKNGDVMIEAEGEEESLGRLIQWCHKGPSRAEVKEVIYNEAKLKNFEEFKLLR